MEILKNKEPKEKKEEYFDLTELLEHVQESEDWICTVFKEPQGNMDDELIYYNKELNLAFKFIIDKETNTVGMKKIDPAMLQIEAKEKCA